LTRDLFLSKSTSYTTLSSSECMTTNT
jgi:hypothetical protein